MPNGSRRAALPCLLFVLALTPTRAAPGGQAPAAPVGSPRPHIVLFLADDFSWHDAGPYGNRDVRTPHLDRLAREGLRFDAAFAASPTCTPSRSSLYTGMYPFRNGAHANHSLVSAGVRTLPRRMEDLGYRVVLAGKTHIGPRDALPFEYLPDSNVMPPGKNHVLWTDLNTAAVDTLLASHEREKQPLCLIVCSHSPHVYWPPNEGYDPSQITPPPYLLDTPETRQALARYYTDVTWMDKQVGDVLASLDKHGYARDTLTLFAADQGAQVPFAKWNLYDAGIRVPLIARWPGKTRPGSSTAAMVSLVDLLPTFIEAAGATPPGQAEVDGRSFLPVLFGKGDRHRTEVYAAHTGDGKMNRSPMRCVRTGRFKYVLNLKPDDEYRTHISDGNHEDGRFQWEAWTRLAKTDPKAAAFIQRYRRRPAEELFEVSNDPYEQRNLAGDPAYAATLADLRKKLTDWRVQQGEDLSKVPMPEDARTGQVPYAK